MIYYKKMTKDQVIKWWGDIIGNTPTIKDLPKEEKSGLLQDEVVYAVIPKYGFGAQSTKEFEDFLYTLNSEFKKHDLGENASEYMKQYNHWLLYAIHINKDGKDSKRSEWIVIDQDKLTFIEKIYRHKFLNQDFMSTEEDDSKPVRKGKYGKPKKYSN